MGLFDLFSGSDQRKASRDAIAQIQASQQQATDALNQGKEQGLQAVDQGQDASLDELSRGFGDARNEYSAASDLYTPYATTGLNAFNLYADATGVNGADGVTRARAAFTDSPGYTKMVDDATDATARKFSALGALGSGNTVQAVTDRASDLADRSYQEYLGNLDNVAKTGYSATGAQAGLTKGIGDLYAQESSAKSGVDQSSAASRVGIDAGTAGNLASTYTTDGNNIAGYTYKAGMADQDASKNLWNAVLGIGNVGASILGAKAGGAGGFAKLAGLAS